jgi:glucokinase
MAEVAPAVPGSPLAIGVDIGGTKIAAGVVDEFGAVLDLELRPTPGTDVRATEDTISEVVATLMGRHEIVAVGIGAAGWIGVDRATVLFSPHLAWRDEPLRAALAHRIPVPVVVENDANAAAWAEHRFGAGQGASVLICVTLGTGIGGGLVIGDQVYRGAYGVAAEYGHMTLVPDGRRCACGNRGCWEMYASGRALARDGRELADVSAMAAARMIELADGVPTGITGPMVTQAAREGDEAALELFETMGRWLGRGLASLAAALDPEVIVIGGGLSDAGELLLRPAREAFRSSLTGRGHRPVARIEVASLGPQAGLVGAADLARATVTS